MAKKKSTTTSKAEPGAKPSSLGPPAQRAEPPALVTTIERLDGALGTAEHAFLVLALFSLIGVGTYQFIASRLFSVNDTWPFEALRYLVFFCAMGGASLAAQKGRMISMDFLARKLPSRGRVVLRIFVSLFVVFACFLLFKGGMTVRDAVSGEEYDLIKPSTAFLALPVGGVLIGLHYLLHSIVDAIYLANGQIPPEEVAPQAH